MEKDDPEIRYNVTLGTSDRSGEFVIEMTHRNGGKQIYMGAVFEQTADSDFTNEVFETLEDASRYPYPSEQTAAAIILSLPDTQNIDYAVVEAKGGK